MHKQFTRCFVAMLSLCGSSLLYGGCAASTDSGEELPVFQAISEGEADEEISLLGPENYVGSWRREPSCTLCGNFKVEERKVAGTCDSRSYANDFAVATLICQAGGCGSLRSYHDACIDRPKEGKYDRTEYVGCCQ